MRGLAVLILLTLAGSVAAQVPTVYEPAGNDDPVQLLSYDATNQRFLAHSAWLDDQEVHHYQFRLYGPDNYGTNPATTPRQIPIQNLYLPSTDGTFAGIPEDQRPVLPSYPVAGDTGYSDFKRIVLVEVPDGYVANSHTDLDLLNAGPHAETGIVVNAPVVPVGSWLEHPERPGDSLTIIRSWPAWFNGDDAQMFVFETTSQSFANYIQPLTRMETGGPGSGYEVVVTPFATSESVGFIPLWHLNEYEAGVTAANHGGPNPAGQRNVLDRDRLDVGYSPLRQIQWHAQVPIGYVADQASSAEQFTRANGFDGATTWRFVNAPTVGPPGETNTRRIDDFGLGKIGSILLQGSLYMQGGETITFHAEGIELGNATTNEWGLYTYRVNTAALPGLAVTAMHNGAPIATFQFEESSNKDPGFTLHHGLVLTVVIGVTILLARRTA